MAWRQRLLASGSRNTARQGSFGWEPHRQRRPGVCSMACSKAHEGTSIPNKAWASQMKRTPDVQALGQQAVHECGRQAAQRAQRQPANHIVFIARQHLRGVAGRQGERGQAGVGGQAGGCGWRRHLTRCGVRAGQTRRRRHRQLQQWIPQDAPSLTRSRMAAHVSARAMWNCGANRAEAWGFGSSRYRRNVAQDRRRRARPWWRQRQRLPPSQLCPRALVPMPSRVWRRWRGNQLHSGNQMHCRLCWPHEAAAPRRGACRLRHAGPPAPP